MKFKNLMVVLITVLALMLIAMPVLGQGYGTVAVTGILSGDSTGPLNPAGYLIGTNPATYWGFQPGSTQGWAELTLAQPSLIYGLALTGILAPGTQLNFDYNQNGQWLPFTAGMVTNLPANGIIDLSHDRVVTAQIRLRLTGAGVAASRLAELQIIGADPDQLYHKIQPLTVTGSANTSPSASAQFLVDGDTDTVWQTRPGFYDNQADQDWFEAFYNCLCNWFTGTNDNPPACHDPRVSSTGQVLFGLPPNCTLSNINIFFSDQARGDVTLEALQNGTWQQLGIIPNQTQLGWYRLDLSANPVSTTEIRLTVTGNTAVVGGISEVEFWGYGADAGDYHQPIGGLTSTIAVTVPLNGAFQLPDGDTNGYTLEFATAETTTQSLAVDLNGQGLVLPPALTINGHTFYHYPIPAADFWPGPNFIRLQPDNPGLTVINAGITKSNSAGEEGFNFGALNDGLFLTPVALGPVTTLTLNQQTLVAEVRVYTTPDADFDLLALVNGVWTKLAKSGNAGGVITFNGPITTNELQLENSGGYGAAELQVLGSPITDQAPLLQILTPNDGDILDFHSQPDLIGFVDNPAARVTVNGLAADQDGQYFLINLARLGITPWEPMTVTVTAIDPEQRETTITLTVLWGEPPLLQLDQPDQLVYTTQGSFTVSGQASWPHCTVTVNGQPVMLTVNQAFSAKVSLQEGLNLIQIQGTVTAGNKQFTETLSRKVVLNTAAPVLTIDAPQPGTYLNTASTVVTGTVGDLSPVQLVTVNGSPAQLSGSSYLSAPVSLAAGANTITVTATDAAGRTTTQRVVVYQDNVAPAISGVLPVNGYISAQDTITVTGTVQAAGPVWVLVNGQAAAITNGVFTGQATFSADGPGVINITVVDIAGNSTSASPINVIVDTTPPLPFDVVATPSGWTNDNQPVITFSTTDAGSGIDHYELAVDQGAFQTVTSPYQLPPQPDGVHTVTVKAFDRAGNVTAESGQIFIDTTPPPVPAQFEAVPGTNTVMLQWQDPAGIIIGYRINRTPAFPEGGYRELVRSSGDSQPNSYINQYLDPDVTPGQAYTYTLQAIDHAENYSVATAPLTATVGIASQSISPTGGTTQFDRCTLNLAPGALGTAGQLVLQASTDTLPANQYAAPVGTAYNFALQDQTGQEIHPTFAAPVTLTISYQGLTLPTGLNALNLGIYWYNKDGGYWEKLDYVTNDIVNQTLTVQLSHFSDYQVMASNYLSPSLDSYYNLGVSPFQAYFQNNVESVSPYDGSLSANATDLKLPGRGGFDLVLTRMYSSDQANQDGIISANINGDNYTMPLDTFSQGWTLNLPDIEQNDKGQFLRLPEGQTIKIDWAADLFIYHAGEHFTLQHTPGQTYEYVLTLKNGVVYDFDTSGKPLLQVDPSGKNMIAYQYTGRQLTQITDSIGRVIHFTYQNNQISQIQVDNTNMIIKYQYDGSGNLCSVTDPCGRVTTYQYQSQSIKTGTTCSYSYTLLFGDQYSGSDDNTKTYTVNLLNNITYPTGGTSGYTYELLDQHRHDDYTDPYNYNCLVFFTCTTQIYSSDDYYNQKIVVSSSNVAGGTTSYSYTLNSELGDLRNSFLPANLYITSANVTIGGKTINYNFQQLYNNNLVSSISTMNDDYQGNILIGQTIQNNGAEFETVNYVYLSGDLAIRAVSTEEHYRGGQLIYQINNRYDAWGNQTYCWDSSRQLETDTQYCTILGNNILVANTSTINLNALTGQSATVATSYQYDATLGKPTQVTVNDGNQTLITSFTYYANGNLQTQTKPNGLVTEFIYDSTYQAFPAQQIIHGVQDADGNLSDITTNYSYNWETGLKQWEQDPLGFVTNYQYDALGRTTQINLPDDNPNNHPSRTYAFDDQHNTCTFTNEIGQQIVYTFDGLGRLIEIDKLTPHLPYSGQKVTTKYQYDNFGNIGQVTDPRGYVTSYQYDCLLRKTKITYPDNSSVTYGYDDTNNTVTITDENGGVTSEQKDWANRLVEAIQNCSFNGATATYTWQYVYDSLDHKLRQIDPLGNQTDQGFDPLGHLIMTTLPAAVLVPPGANQPQNYIAACTSAYDNMGNKTADVDARGNRTSYGYDQLGREISSTTQATDIFTGQTTTAVTKYYYDAAGNKTKVIDPNGGASVYTYSARGFLLSTQDQAGHLTLYQYDALGNKTAVTDPRSNGSNGLFTTWYVYDDLNRLAQTILPDNTPGPNAGNPSTAITYDEAGNKLTERDANGVITSYTYTPRNWVATVTVGGQLRATYSYDNKGNKIAAQDASNNITHFEYDSLGRLRHTVHPLSNDEKFSYDGVGNRVLTQDGRGNQTQYAYNSLGMLTAVTDPLWNVTQYWYDPNGNKVALIGANNLTTGYRYDELNRLTAETDSLGQTTQSDYDPAGNLKQQLDRRGTVWGYQYNPDNSLQSLNLTGTDGSVYTKTYQYDAAGNTIQVSDSNGSIIYNSPNGQYQPDPLNRINNVERQFDSADYQTAYQYDPAGQLTGILYPGASAWLAYRYNSLNQLNEVTGFTTPQGITYNANGALQGIADINGVTAAYQYDGNSRLQNLSVQNGGATILGFSYTYDATNNITGINGKLFNYDAANQLTGSVIPGNFLEDQTTPGNCGAVTGDLAGAGELDFGMDSQALLALDYDSSSIGIDFGAVAPGVKQIVIAPDQAHQSNRLTDHALMVYTSNDNATYTLVPRANWTYSKAQDGSITLTLQNRLATRYLKLHVLFDDRDQNLQPVNQAQFLNQLAGMIQVYQEAPSRTEAFQYDAAGNRILQQITLVQSSTFQSLYYANSNHLQTDGKYAYAYDAAGNLIKKGNTFTINGATVNFTTTGAGVIYWEYQYDLLNRLIQATKNGMMVATYSYDPDGYRVVKKANSQTIHYIFGGQEPLMENNITTNQIHSYIYALDLHLARVDGAIGSGATVYFYHTDHLGSVQAVTDQQGNVVCSQDYLPFGDSFGATGNFTDSLGFTGKEYDQDIGLYYFNARWYDPDLGRFISEDSAGDGLNWYRYCYNNPLIYNDPTGYYGDTLVATILSGIAAVICSVVPGLQFLDVIFVPMFAGNFSILANSVDTYGWKGFASDDLFFGASIPFGDTGSPAPPAPPPTLPPPTNLAPTKNLSITNSGTNNSSTGNSSTGNSLPLNNNNNLDSADFYLSVYLSMPDEYKPLNQTYPLFLSTMSVIVNQQQVQAIVPILSESDLNLIKSVKPLNQFNYQSNNSMLDWTGPQPDYSTQGPVLRQWDPKDDIWGNDAEESGAEDEPHDPTEGVPRGEKREGDWFRYYIVPYGEEWGGEEAP